MFHSLDVSNTGLVAQRQRMNTIAGNIANINTTRDSKGQPSPFQRQIVLFQAESGADGSQDGKQVAGVGVRVEVKNDPEAKTRKIPDADHPDAVDGYVSYPDINLNTEFVNALEASRAYEANVAAIEASKAMMSQALRILT